MINFIATIKVRGVSGQKYNNIILFYYSLAITQTYFLYRVMHYIRCYGKYIGLSDNETMYIIVMTIS